MSSLSKVAVVWKDGLIYQKPGYAITPSNQKVHVDGHFGDLHTSQGLVKGVVQGSEVDSKHQ